MEYKIGDTFGIDKYYEACQFCNAWNEEHTEDMITVANKGENIYEIVAMTPLQHDAIIENKIHEYEEKLSATDYINDKINEARTFGTAEYLAELIEEYKSVAEQREEWRQEIRKLKKELKGE